MAKKKTKKSASASTHGKFSLVALHRELGKVKDRLRSAPKTKKMVQLAADTDAATKMMFCDQGMNRNFY